MKTTLTFTGGAELAEALNGLSARVSRKVIIEALKYGAEPMQARMSQLAPREPGAPDLADNIVISTANRADAREHAVAVGPSKAFFYGLMQEYGTVHHGAQPFMRPAFDAEAPKALGRIGQELWRALASRGVIRTGTSPSAPSGEDAFLAGTAGLGHGTHQPTPRGKQR